MERHRIPKRGQKERAELAMEKKNPRLLQELPKGKSRLEKAFERICKENSLPFKYVGNGDFWIGRDPSINPDFIHKDGGKVAVEIFSENFPRP